VPDIRLGKPEQAIPQYKMLHITGAGTLVPVGLCVNTTIAATITAGSNVTITPSSMVNITKGKRLNIVNGATTDNITVISVTGSTFVATFANSYGASSNLYSVDGTVLGPIIVGNTGSGVTLTLYNGLPGMLPKAGAIVSVITLPTTGAGISPIPLDYAGICDLGLFYTLAVVTTAPDITLHYLDHPPQF